MRRLDDEGLKSERRRRRGAAEEGQVRLRLVRRGWERARLRWMLKRRERLRVRVGRLGMRMRMWMWMLMLLSNLHSRRRHSH